MYRIVVAKKEDNMETKGKKIIVVVIIALLIITSVIGIILSGKVEENSGGNNNSNEKNELTINKKITELTDEKTYYALEEIINNFLEAYTNKKSNSVYKMLDKNYIIENSITSNNVLEKLNIEYQSANFTINDVYYNENSLITYYFITGDVFNITDYETDNFSYDKNVSFLVIEKNSYYVLIPLKNNIDIKTYSNNYNIKDIEIEKNNNFVKKEINENNKLINYINYFKNLVIFNPEKAYNMLNEETKLKYSNYDDFYDKSIDIYNNLSTNVFASSKQEYSDRIEYEIKDQKQNKITIIEYRIYKYTIGY